MSIKVGDIGRPIYVPTNFDLSGSTELEIKFTSPDGTVSFTKNTSDGVTAPSSPSPDLPNDPETGFPGGVFPADTYMLYLNVAGDFDAGGAGLWNVCTAYTDGTPKYYQGLDGLLNIGSACK
jgi:hypothetical protein